MRWIFICEMCFIYLYTILYHYNPIYNNRSHDIHLYALIQKLWSFKSFQYISTILAADPVDVQGEKSYELGETLAWDVGTVSKSEAKLRALLASNLKSINMAHSKLQKKTSIWKLNKTAAVVFCFPAEKLVQAFVLLCPHEMFKFFSII